MEPIDLEPRYSTNEIPGKCLKCLTEQGLDGCLRLLLMEKGESGELKEMYAALLSFLKSPESKKLRDKAEKYLSEGKQVNLVISGEGKYELKVK